MVKNLSAVLETQIRSLGWEDSPGEGNGYPLQYSSLKNSMDRGAWWATVLRVAKGQIQLSNWHLHVYFHKHTYHIFHSFLWNLFIWFCLLVHKFEWMTKSYQCFSCLPQSNILTTRMLTKPNMSYASLKFLFSHYALSSRFYLFYFCINWAQTLYSIYF